MLIYFRVTFFQFLEGRNFRESTIWTDIKILILAISCILGYLSHFVMRFPRDADQVGMCLAGYCVLMSLHYYIENYKEKGAFFVSKSHEYPKFKEWQTMKFSSEVVVTDDNLSADYELMIEAFGT